MIKNLNLFFISIILFISCEKSFEPLKVEYKCNSENNINFIFKYGIGGKNVINTFNCTFTKDMVCDPSVTTFLQFKSDEKDSILSKMNQIDFFNYPDTFKVKITGDSIGHFSPYSLFYFYVEIGDLKKELFWADSMLNIDYNSIKLRDLINLIISIIASKKEYINLPPSKCLYA
jgi:hypothetical protein